MIFLKVSEQASYICLCFSFTFTMVTNMEIPNRHVIKIKSYKLVTNHHTADTIVITDSSVHAALAQTYYGYMQINQRMHA